MPEVVTVGEAMVVMTPLERFRLRSANLFEKRMGGTEAHFAVGTARLGISTGWVSRLGDDEFGYYILEMMRAEGVDVSRVRMVPTHPTAVMFKEIRELGPSRTFFYRAGSAASTLQPEDVDPEYLEQARLVHLSGIMPALNSSCYATVRRVFQVARQRGIPISFDPKMRLQLWKSEKECIRVLRALSARSGIVLSGREEALLLTGTSTPEAAAAQYLRMGPDVAVVKLGADGALAARAGELVHVPAFPVRESRDRGCAGDAFNAGFIAGHLRGFSLRECVHLGNAAAAMVIGMQGEANSLPDWSEVQALLARAGGTTG